MGDGVRIDPEVISSVAAGLSESAEAIAASASVVDALLFGPTSAGRSYADLGARFAQGYRRIDGAVCAWSTAGHDVADALDATVTAYQDGDESASVAIEHAGRTR